MRGIHLLAIVFFSLIALVSGCVNQERKNFEAHLKEGERLAKIYCTSCHAEDPPELLDKITWTFKVMPQMGPRLGMHNYKTIYYERIHPLAEAKMPAMNQEQWESIVDYFHHKSPEVLPKQKFIEEPEKECKTFSTSEFNQGISSGSIISMLEVDTTHKYIFAADIQNSMLFKFDYERKLVDSLHLSSPPTAMNIDHDFFEITLAGILHPNNEAKGEVVRYTTVDQFKHTNSVQLIDSLIRPVASQRYDFNYDGKEDFLICEYGNDIGRLAIYYSKGKEGYEQYIIENVPGSIMVKVKDMNNDGFMDIIALYAQGDERVMIYYNDGKGEFRGNFTRAARFPSVYGSMYFELMDYNQDEYVDILYVNGDNFDYSQILKPYHGIRILENDGENNFEEKYFFPIYGAGKSVTYDFDLDGDLDIIVTSNFADMDNNPERGIIYLENRGGYNFKAYSFEAASQNQWNTIDLVDLDSDGDQDILIGAMNLGNILKVQNNDLRGEVDLSRASLLLLKNETY